jgi:hypothetical protein
MAGSKSKSVVKFKYLGIAVTNQIAFTKLRAD